MDNIEIIKETLNYVQTNRYLNILTTVAVHNTTLIEEGFRSWKSPYYADSHVSFEENLTLIPAYRYADQNLKTAVLCFANPVEPGGGVFRGASAQEEYLCRASNLYPSLASEAVKQFYQTHEWIRQMNQSDSMILGTDRVIYSPGITFIREDQNYAPGSMCNPTQVYSDHWRTLDVLTCAAPFFREPRHALPNGELQYLMCRRITNILEAAIEHDVEVLILGAFGCGAFHNPPTVVANAFQSVLLQKRYLHAFRNVIFAVKRTGMFSENIEAFEIAFQQFPPTGQYVFSEERNKRRFFE